MTGEIQLRGRMIPTNVPLSTRARELGTLLAARDASILTCHQDPPMSLHHHSGQVDPEAQSRETILSIGTIQKAPQTGVRMILQKAGRLRGQRLRGQTQTVLPPLPQLVKLHGLMRLTASPKKPLGGDRPVLQVLGAHKEEEVGAMPLKKQHRRKQPPKQTQPRVLWGRKRLHGALKDLTGPTQAVVILIETDATKEMTLMLSWKIHRHRYRPGIHFLRLL